MASCSQAGSLRDSGSWGARRCSITRRERSRRRDQAPRAARLRGRSPGCRLGSRVGKKCASSSSSSSVWTASCRRRAGHRRTPTGASRTAAGHTRSSPGGGGRQLRRRTSQRERAVVRAPNVADDGRSMARSSRRSFRRPDERDPEVRRDRDPGRRRADMAELDAHSRRPGCRPQTGTAAAARRSSPETARSAPFDWSPLSPAAPACRCAPTSR